MEVTSDIYRVYEQHREPMMRLALRLLGDSEEANDVVSDVFAHIVETPAAIRDNAASYMLFSVRNRCLNLLRHKRLSERVHKLLPIGEDIVEEPQIDETEDVLDAMLQFVDTELTPQTREVVRLRFQEQMSYREISTRLGISEVAVYKHLVQAISRPLAVKLGNPDLKPAAKTHFGASYYDGNGSNQGGMYHLSASFDYHHRDIAQSVSYNPATGVYTYKPMNVSGAYKAHADFSTDHNIGEKRYWSWHVNAGADWNHSKDHALLEGQTESQVNTVNTLTLNGGANIRYNYKTLNVRAVGSIDWRHSDGKMYDFSTLNAFEFSYGLEASWTTPALSGKKVGGLTLSADGCMYSRRGYGAADLNRDDFVINASISQPFLSGKLILRLQAFDLLHQLSATDYNVNAQGRTITTYRSLPHYVMLHAVWHFNKKPKKK